MTTARTIVTLALESMNRLSPGEVIDADLAAMAMRQLNAIADQAGAGRDMLFKQAFTSGRVTGASFTLAAGSFAAVGIGDEIEGMTADNYQMAPITMAQYRDIFNKATALGRPQFYAHDGAVTVFLYPVANANLITIQSRIELSQFADLDTDYAMPSGYLMFFASALAVALAPALLGAVTPSLKLNAKAAEHTIQGGNVRPMIIGGDPINGARQAGSTVGAFLGGW